MTQAKENKTEIEINIEEMAKNGVHLGHRSSKCHPKMKPYVLGVKGSDHIHIINLEITAQKLREALEFIQVLVREGKTILFVGTRPGVQNLIKDLAQECDFPYVENRWIGGTLTNFEVIKKRIDYLKELEKKRESGEFNKYTKKERMKFDKEIQDLERKLGGIKTLEKLPDAIFIVDMHREKTAVREAKKKGIPLIAITDTNVDPTLADWPIPANDDAISSVKYILEKVKEAILKAKSK
jgi:small subunit ribosomal protein S2